MTKEYVVRICDACLAGEGEECHTEDCAFWMDDTPKLVEAFVRPYDSTEKDRQQITHTLEAGIAAGKAARKKDERIAELEAAIKEPIVLRLCEKCHQEYRLPLARCGNATLNLVCNFTDCPKCGARDDAWVMVRVDDMLAEKKFAFTPEECPRESLHETSFEGCTACGFGLKGEEEWPDITPGDLDAGTLDFLDKVQGKTEEEWKGQKCSVCGKPIISANYARNEQGWCHLGCMFKSEEKESG